LKINFQMYFINFRAYMHCGFYFLEGQGLFGNKIGSICNYFPPGLDGGLVCNIPRGSLAIRPRRRGIFDRQPSDPDPKAQNRS
jgi:hypothetical protein